MDSKVILFLIALQGFLTRLFSVFKHEVILHEYDPYFNYKCAEYLQRHGLAKFMQSFDDGTWYPFGRHVGHTVYPGLMVTAYVLYKLTECIGLDISLKTICVLLPPFMSTFTVCGVYSLAKEVAKDETTALFSAFFMGSIPSLLTRTSSGTFDNEAVAIPLMVCSLHRWLVALHSPSFVACVLASALTYLMALSWGGYVYLLNSIACYTAAGVILGISVKRLSTVYVIYHGLTATLCFSVPVIGSSIVTAMEMKLPHLVCIAGILLIAITCLIEQRASGIQIIAILTAFTWCLILLSLSGKTSSLTARLGQLFGQGKAGFENPLVTSISEHQPTRWMNILMDMWIALVYIPMGFFLCFRDSIKIGRLTIAMYGVISSYFAVAMVRLGLLLAPAASILGGIGVAYTLKASKMKGTNKHNGIIYAAITAALLISHITHCTLIASTVYSIPNVMSSWRSYTGERLVSDDFRDAYGWMRHNIKGRAVVFAWWDYGYQLRQMANCCVVTDNNTSDHEQIAMTALIFASEEEAAHKMLTNLGVEYVMVVYGGIAKFGMDDVSKFPWMIRIAAKEYTHIQQMRFFGSKGKECARETLLYKLCYHRVHEASVEDNVRKEKVIEVYLSPERFVEVFTSENWLVRIYMVKGKFAPAHRDS